VPPAPWRVLSLIPLPVDFVRGLLGEGEWDLVVPADRSHQAMIDAAPGAEVLLGEWGRRLRIGEDLLAAAPTLAFVQQPAAGADFIDLPVFAQHGIPVANTGSANTVAVAEWCLLAALALLRGTVDADRAIRNGDWPQLDPPVRELAGLQVAILGMGLIGVAAAERFAALGARVSYWSRTRRPDLPYEYRTLDELLRGAEVLVGVLPSAPETRGLLDADAFALLPAGALVINAGRGDLIDEQALAEGLRSGRVGGAALDVFATEPLPADAELRAAPRLLLAPHHAGATRQAQRRIFHNVAANLQRVRLGEPVRDVVNGAHPQVRRRS
jgi:phosphoglycerate dehydrogenase-like enzyme